MRKCTSLLNASSGCITSLMSNWWNGEMLVVVMITPAGPAQQGHLWKLNEWRNWFWITSESLGSSVLYITLRTLHLTIMRKWIWLWIVCKCSSPISIVMEFLNSCQDVKMWSIFLGFVLKIMILKWNKWAAFNIVRNFCFIFII